MSPSSAEAPERAARTRGMSPLARLTSRSPAENLATIRDRVVPGLRHLPQSRVRRCRACLRPSLFLSLSAGEEFTNCLRCGANLRYELLAEQLRARRDLASLDVVELDAGSPLAPVLRGARSYVETAFSADPAELGHAGPDGIRREDVTRLTFPDASIDLLVSSEVLEHVEDLDAAFAETERVLRPGGEHLFTVPPKQVTARRAEHVDGELVHHLPPDFHGDPRNPEGGILAFWDIGMDAPQVLSRPGLRLELAAGPEGRDGRVVWRATRVAQG